MEQSEARLNTQISSLTENLTAARKEAEDAQKKMKEAEDKLTVSEKQIDNVRGEVAGEILRCSIIYCYTLFLLGRAWLAQLVRSLPSYYKVCSSIPALP